MLATATMSVSRAFARLLANVFFPRVHGLLFDRRVDGEHHHAPHQQGGDGEHPDHVVSIDGASLGTHQDAAGATDDGGDDDGWANGFEKLADFAHGGEALRELCKENKLAACFFAGKNH